MDNILTIMGKEDLAKVYNMNSDFMKAGSYKQIECNTNQIYVKVTLKHIM
jgi:hypothetical protein